MRRRAERRFLVGEIHNFHFVNTRLTIFNQSNTLTPMKALMAIQGVSGPSGAWCPAFRRSEALAVCYRGSKRRRFDRIGLNLTKFDRFFYFPESETQLSLGQSQQIRSNLTKQAAPVCGPGATCPCKVNPSKSNLSGTSNTLVLRQNGTKLRRAFAKSRLIKVNQGSFFYPGAGVAPGVDSLERTRFSRPLTASRGYTDQTLP